MWLPQAICIPGLVGWCWVRQDDSEQSLKDRYIQQALRILGCKSSTPIEANEEKLEDPPTLVATSLLLFACGMAMLEATSEHSHSTISHSNIAIACAMMWHSSTLATWKWQDLSNSWSVSAAVLITTAICMLIAFFTHRPFIAIFLLIWLRRLLLALDGSREKRGPWTSSIRSQRCRTKTSLKTWIGRAES